MAEDMLEKNVPILNAGFVKMQVKKNTDLEVRDAEVRGVLRKDMRLGWRMAKKVPIQSNTARCLVLRQQYAIKMLDLLE